MNTSFVNRKDRIIASAIEIISEAGLASLNTRTLAMKENMSESLLYRYFGGIDEVLVEVAEAFTKFDRSMLATISAKDIPHIDKVVEFFKTLSVYYEGYVEMGSLVLNYEGLLHNVSTRDIIAECIYCRTDFVRTELQSAMDEGEIRDIFTAEELANLFLGSASRDMLNRRIENDEKPHSQVSMETVNKIISLLRIPSDI